MSPIPAPTSMLQALERVLSPSGFPYASNDHLFKSAQFGRDSLEVAEDLLSIRPDVARAVILRLPELQGTAHNPTTEEESGKIHHEHRARIMGGAPVDEESLKIMRHLAAFWQVASTPEEIEALQELTVYSTVDATPLFVRLVHRYVEAFGPHILDTTYRQARSSQVRTVRDSVAAAVDWISRSTERSALGLLEWQRMTPHGSTFQAWKDGGTSYLHPDGEYCYPDAPIASIEVQGLAYDALTVAEALLPNAPESDRERWRRQARGLQTAVVDRFWMPEESYFAMAIDRNPASGEPRQVRTVTSNPAAMLETGIFDTLPDEERWRYVRAITERIFSPEFLTEAGIRTTSLLHQDVLPYPAYQSSFTVWHKETYDIARGMRRQGLPHLARELETRLLNAVNLTGGATEFLYVMADGRVDYSPLDLSDEPGEVILGTNVPENDQAWTISAALAIKWQRGHPHPLPPPTDLERSIVNRIGTMRVLRTVREVEEARPTYRFRINTRAGWEREKAFRAEQAAQLGGDSHPILVIE